MEAYNASKQLTDTFMESIPDVPDKMMGDQLEASRQQQREDRVFFQSVIREQHKRTPTKRLRLEGPNDSEFSFSCSQP